MTRLVKVSGRGDGTDWKSALKDLQRIKRLTA